MDEKHNVREQLAQISARAKKIAIEYRRITEKPLGITGEIGEMEAARLLGLTLADARTSGHDAIDGQGQRIEIKSRVLQNLKRRNQKMGKIKNLTDCDRYVLVLMNPDYEVEEIYEAAREKVVEALQKGESRARQSGALNISEFIRLGKQCWPLESPKLA